MSWYRRWRQPGGLYFFTVVSYGRRPILTGDLERRTLRVAIEQTRLQRPWEIVAMVLLPDHLHCLWRLPPDDDDYPTRWRLIKSRFTRALLAAGCAEPRPGTSRRRRQEHAIWQRRGWEHVVRDETDWKNHLDYIHYNAVKHGLAAAPGRWPYSTFLKYVQLGEYSSDWGAVEPENLAGWVAPGGFIEDTRACKHAPYVLQFANRPRGTVCERRIWCWPSRWSCCLWSCCCGRSSWPCRGRWQGDCRRGSARE